MRIKLADVVSAEAQMVADAIGHTRLGTRFIPVTGGNGYQDDDDEDDNKDDDDSKSKKSDDDDDKEDDSETPKRPETDEEWADWLAEHNKANRTAAKRKEEREDLRKQLAEAKKNGGKKSKDSTKDDDDDRLDADAVQERIAEATTQRDAEVWKPYVVELAATKLMVELGYTGSMDRLPRYIKRELDMDEIDLTVEDGKVDLDGLEDEVRAFKKSNPDLFGKRGPGRISTTDKDDKSDGGKKIDPVSQKMLEAAGVVSRRSRS